MSRGDAAATANPGADEAGSTEARRLHDWVRAGRSFSGRERHCFFRNAHDATFENLSAVSGLDVADDGRAAAFTDWDQDGDLDLWIANRSGPQLRFFENGRPSPGTSLVLRLEGRRGNRDAIGARVVVRVGDEPPQSRTVTAGSGFLAQSSKAVHFGIGEAGSADVVVHWPGGETETFANLAAGAPHVIVEGGGSATRAAGVPGVPAPRPSGPVPAPVLAPTELARVFSATRVTLPRLGFTTFEGAERTVPARPERPLLIVLWAGWCAPCLEELSSLAAAREPLAAAGLDVLALTVDTDDEVAAARERLAAIGFPFAAARAQERTVDLLQRVNDRVLDRHRPLPLPSSFLVTTAGRLAAVYKGPVEVDTLLADVERLSLDGAALRAASLPFPGRWVREDEIPAFRPFALAGELVESGYLSEAVDFTERTRAELESDPRLGILLARFGNEFFTRGQFDDAIDFYRRAIERDPDFPAARLNLGISLNRRGERQAAETQLRRAVELDPDNTLALRELAMNLALGGRATEAVPLFREALRLDPKDMTAAIHLARLLAPTDPAEALELARAADAATGHQHPNVLAILADAQAASGDTAAASTTAAQALALARQHGLDALAAELEAKLAAWRAR